MIACFRKKNTSPHLASGKSSDVNIDRSSSITDMATIISPENCEEVVEESPLAPIPHFGEISLVSLTFRLYPLLN